MAQLARFFLPPSKVEEEKNTGVLKFTSSEAPAIASEENLSSKVRLVRAVRLYLPFLSRDDVARIEASQLGSTHESLVDLIPAPREGVHPYI